VPLVSAHIFEDLVLKYPKFQKILLFLYPMYQKNPMSL
jgi:hypothetical protein